MKVVFPNLFEQIGAKLVQDSIVQVTGKNSARDRNGNLGDESKLIADEIVFIDDDVVKNYESTGQKIAAPKISSKVKQEKRAIYQAKKTGVSTTGKVVVENSPKSSVGQSTALHPEPKISTERLFLHVKDPSDHDKLVTLKSLCSNSPGLNEVVLVLGDEKKSAMRMPFKVDVEGSLLGELQDLLGEECVKLK